MTTSTPSSTRSTRCLESNAEDFVKSFIQKGGE